MNLSCDPGFVSKLKALLGFIVLFLLMYVPASANGDNTLNKTTLRVAAPFANTPPQAARDSMLVRTNISTTGNVLANDTDPENDGLTASLVTAPVNGTVVLNADGNLTYTPNANFNGEDSLVYQVCDNGTPSLCDTAILLFRVGNHAPVAITDNTIVQEDTPASGNVLTNDSDIDGDGIIASLVTAPVNGTVVLNADGSFTYTPNNNYNGADSLIYQVCDNGTPSLCDTATLLLYVSGVNDAPVAVDDNIPVTEDTPATGNIRSNDSDLETTTDSLMVSLVIAPVHGTVILDQEGNFTYTPAANYSGLDSLIYRLCDPDFLCDTAKVIFTITTLNDAPIAMRDTLTVTEDTPATGNVLTNDTDIEGNALTASLVTAPVQGTVVLNADGSFTYTPNANYNGADSLIYQVCDNGTPSLCDTATLLFNVAEVNDAPVAARDTLAVTEDTPATGNVLTNDTDIENNTLTASLVIAPIQGTVVLNADGSFTYTPNANYNGADSLIYQICDNGTPSLCDTATVLFNVAGANDAPIAVRDTLAVTEDTPATGNVLTNDTDIEGNALTASLVIAPVQGTIVLNADGSFTYTPNANYSGADSLIYQVCDNGTPSLCDTATLLFNVAEVNDAPVAARDTLAVTEDTPATGNVLTNDTDIENNTLTASLVTAPIQGTVVLNADGSFTYTPNANYSGADSLIYQVCDNGTPSLCDTATLLFNVAGVNDEPVAMRDTLAVTEDTPATGNVLTNDTDIEGNALTASLVIAPVQGTIVLNADGSFTYTPNANYSGTDSLIYQVCDNGMPLLCDTATLLFNVAGVNDEPVAMRDTLAVTEDTPATGNVLTNDTDIEGNALTASLVIAPVQGTIVLNADGSFTYTPNANYSGADSLIYQICDNGTPSLCDTATVLFNVAAVNNKPVAVNDSIAVTEDVPVTGNVRNNDSDPETATDSLVVSLVTGPTHGTAALNADGDVTYTPAANYGGVDSLIYKLCDPDGLCDTATVVFTITASNDAPVAVNDSIAVTEDIPASGNVLTNDSDAENNALTASLVTAPVNGTVVLNADGSFTYTPNANYNGADSLIYRVCDNGTPSLCDTATMLFNVAPANDKPVAVNDSLTTVRGIALNGNVLLNDTDPENNTLIASVITTTANGALALNADGAFTYTSTGNFTGVDVATYKVCDPGGACDTALLVITVTAPAEAPVIGAAMSAAEPVLQPDGRYRTTFTIKIKNYGNVSLQQVTASDNLSAAFAAAAGFNVVSANAGGRLVINNAFDGTGNQQLLSAGSMLAADETGTISLVVDIIPNGNFGPFNNSITVTGTSPAGTMVSDISNNGTEADPSGNGSPSDNGEDAPTPVTLKANAVAGLAKTVSVPVLEVNGDYTVTYTLVVQNLGNVPVTNLQVTDDLSGVFVPPITFNITGDITATGGLVANNSFNGSNNIELLAAGSQVAVSAGDTIRFAVRVTPNKQSGTFNNSASLKGSAAGIAVSDQSTNGLQADPDGNGVPDESVVTPVTLNPTRLHIPEGFSPNGDGRNDRFVIGNAGNDKISLEVYNRWGSAVYKNNDYKNNWDGRSNQGLHSGDVVPDGTYYYIITVNGNDRFASFITIMR